MRNGDSTTAEAVVPNARSSATAKTELKSLPVFTRCDKKTPNLNVFKPLV